MSSIVVVFGMYLCSSAAGDCEMVFNEGEPAFYERKQDCLNFIKRIERPNEKGAWYDCRRFEYDNSTGARSPPEHVPLQPAKT